MAKTRAQLRTAVMEITKRPDKTTLTNNALDHALLTLQNAHFFKAQKTESDLSVVQSDVSVSLPSTFHKLLEVRLIDSNDSYPIEIKYKKWVVQNFPNISADNETKPDYCYEEGGVLYFSCPLDGAYTIRVTYYKLATFVDDSTTNPIPVAESALIFHTVAYVYDALELQAHASRWLQRAEHAEFKAKRSDNREIGEVKKLEEFEGHRTIQRTSDYFIVPNSV